MEHCAIYPRMKKRDFLALNQSANVVLDSFLWSGHNSSFEAIACGRPIVTLPGPMMRGRHTYAILRMMGLDETIAQDQDHYVEIAVRLGTDAEWWEEIARKVENTRSRVFNDETPVRALEDFFERVCHTPKD